MINFNTIRLLKPRISKMASTPDKTYLFMGTIQRVMSFLPETFWFNNPHSLYETRSMRAF
jgi:hypothetical protein